ncbi:transposase [Amycolatopsis japonica]|uniref:transposase n=1 Tax=Amycolatopsis japonica TaxID=208439 RepID=UPI0037B8AB14
MNIEPLASYLRPRFGDIYADKLTVDDGFIDVRPWDPELEQAVAHYLIHEVADDDYLRFLDQVDTDVPNGSREQQAASIIEHQLPWEIADAFHWAAVKCIGSLDQLLGDTNGWESNNQRDDVAVWLDTHATEAQFAELAECANHPERDPATPWYRTRPQGEHFTQHLTPSQLRDAWHHVAGPADSDFTDEEWDLLSARFPLRNDAHGVLSDRRPYELILLRRSYNGIRYRFSKKVPWSRLPRRYGSEGSVYQRFYLDRKNGIFADLAQSLRGVPRGVRLAAWLKLVAGNS